MRAHYCIAAGLAILALAGCGATPPQAPLAEAKKLDVSTSAISSPCGLTYQVTAFARPGRADVSSYEATASRQARKLASVYKLDPAWIYQGETVRKIVHDSIAMLGSCGLTQARCGAHRADPCRVNQAQARCSARRRPRASRRS